MAYKVSKTPKKRQAIAPVKPSAIDNPLSKGEKGKERSATGKFLPGWKGGPGNPYNVQTAAFRKIMYNAYSHEEFLALARRLYDFAMSGDMAAMHMILQYLLGKPKEVESDGESVQQGTNIVIEFRDAKVPEAKAPDAPRGGDSKAVAGHKP